MKSDSCKSDGTGAGDCGGIPPRESGKSSSGESPDTTDTTGADGNPDTPDKGSDEELSAGFSPESSG